MSYAAWELMFTCSLFVVTFCTGAILGAYLVSRRERKILEYFRDEILTNEQNNVIVKDGTLEKVFRK